MKKAKIALAIIISGAIIGSGTGVAYASESDEVKAIDEVEVAASTQAETATVRVESSGVTTEMTLPGKVTTELVDSDKIPEEVDQRTGDAIASTEYGGSTISTFPTESGTQTFIEIPNSSSPNEYRFALNLPLGATASVETDGSVAVRDIEGNVLGGYLEPWALDANNQNIPTKFRIEGAELVQTVELNDSVAYPVIADPSDFWGWAYCVAVVAGEIAANAFVAIRLVALVKRFGSIQRTMEIMWRAWNASTDWEKKWKAVARAVGGAAAEVIGVVQIRNACFT